AVRSRSTAEVADGLALGGRRPMSYADGTDAAYDSGVFVAPPIGEWTLAHGTELSDDIEPLGSDFLPWLAKLSRHLGEVQYFGTHRVSEWHQWARADSGTVLRAFGYADGEVMLSVGEPTAAEIDIDPDEEDVLRIAGQWSVNPGEIDDEAVAEPGLFGSLTWREPGARRTLRSAVPPPYA
ncbi:MAG TPA: hypothetical protein VGJ28_00620, partial [Micromonosporaceae bacterium]